MGGLKMHNKDKEKKCRQSPDDFLSQGFKGCLCEALLGESNLLSSSRGLF